MFHKLSADIGEIKKKINRDEKKSSFTAPGNGKSRGF